MDFGLAPDEVRDYIYEVIESIDKLSISEARQVMQDIYESKFEIFNHISGPHLKDKPLASVAMHYAESSAGIVTVKDMIKYYVDKNIMKYTGVSLNDFLQLPREHVHAIMEAVNKKSREESTIVSGIQAGLDK